jgi:hypothetical protein
VLHNYLTILHKNSHLMVKLKQNTQEWLYNKYLPKQNHNLQVILKISYLTFWDVTSLCALGQSWTPCLNLPSSWGYTLLCLAQIFLKLFTYVSTELYKYICIYIIYVIFIQAKYLVWTQDCIHDNIIHKILLLTFYSNT